MKTIFLFFAIAHLMVFSVYTQTLKKFSGIYSISESLNLDGKANYSYKEENSRQIFHGKFIMSVTGKDDNNGFKQNLAGNFKNGLRDGKWVFITTYNDWKQSDENIFKTGTCTLTINYKSGIPDGVWAYNSSFKIRQKNEKNENHGFTAYSKVTKESIRMAFSQGIISSFQFESSSENSNDAVKTRYTFDEKGFIHNAVNEKEIKTSNEIWYHGIVKPSDEDKANLDKYLRYLKNSKDSLAFLSYTYKTITYSESKILNNLNSADNITAQLSKIYSHFFLWNDIPGDLNYDSAKSKSDVLQNATITGFMSREIVRQNPVEKDLPAEQTIQFRKINELFQSLNNKLTDSKIIKCSVIAEAELTYNISKKYIDTIANIKRLTDELEKYYKGSGTAKSFASVVETSNLFQQISETDILNFSFSKLTLIEKEIQPILIELENYFKKFEYDAAMKEGASYIAQKNFDAAKKAFQRAQFMNPDEQTPKAKIEEIKILEAILEADTKRMKIFNYLVDNFRKIPANYKYGEERKNMYNAYLILKDYYLTGIDNPANDSFKKLEICNEAVKLVEKMNELQNKNTEELEKQLKKIKEPAKIKEILGL